MNDLIVKNVDVFGDTVIATQDENGVIWAGVRWMCDGIGLSRGQMNNEVTKVKEDLVLSKGARNLMLPTKGGKQEALCLQLDYIPLWLAKISITPSMKENNPELVDKLVKYQLRAKDVLAEAFLPKTEEQNVNPLDGISQELQAVIVVDKRVTQVERRIEKLENNMTISHEQIQIIKNRVNKKITEILGGYESNAYNDKHLRGKAYSRFNKDYCDYFRINARANTLASKFEGALSYIDMWIPDTNLMIQIKDCNAQLSMEV